MERTDNQNVMKELGDIMHLAPGQIELLTDMEHVSVPTTRYDELIRAEAELDVLLRAYQNIPSYNLEAAMSIVFGPKDEEKGDAQ